MQRSCSHEEGNQTMPLRRILCVDDDADILNDYYEVLTEHGYEVGKAANAVEFGCQMQDFQPDLVLMDVSMPGLDGLTAVQLMMGSRTAKHLYFVVLSGCLTDARKEHLTKLKVPFLDKPFRFPVLLAMIRDFEKVPPPALRQGA
jgi:DNA-binding response OmpR family regulator